jgi:hypothetical protein
MRGNRWQRRANMRPVMFTDRRGGIGLVEGVIWGSGKIYDDIEK